MYVAWMESKEKESSGSSGEGYNNMAHQENKPYQPQYATQIGDNAAAATTGGYQVSVRR
jgi:hypothetical protein